jgi:hypothetical protein
VREYPELTFSLARGLGSSVQCGAQPPLVPRKRAFRLPALAVLPLRKAAFHLPTILGLGPLPPLATPVDRNDGAPHAQLFAAKAMILFAVEGGITQDAIPADDERSLVEGRGKLGSVVAGAGADGSCREEMAAGVADHGEFGPQPSAVFLAGPLEEVGGGVLTLQARCVDGRFGPFVDQAAVLGAHGGLDEEENDRPFFKSRCSA